ncbi:ABC transporter permease [Neobacillus rhizophilus]|uniref:ABC transporter permease n=1 Tax=Neobacillus rhizophilus TaxID=2833579 RepID=A0A942UA07_9BACI|nr:ABC transporter permease [Neobacillus rhizophilus]MBS4214953.1 ABC transporter permease [Neobacillus rhizophilus]
MLMLGQTIFNGIVIGSLYALVALGLVIVFKSTNRINFAYGQMAMFSTFIGYTLLAKFHLPFMLAFIGALVFSALLAVLVRNILRPAKSESSVIVATLALYMIFTAVAGIIWGWDPVSFPQVFTGEPFSVFGIIMRPNDLFNILLTVILMLMLFLFFKFNLNGIAMRALSQNLVTTSLMGASVNKLFTITWAISGILGGVAGILVAPTSFLDTNLMAVFLLKAFTAAVLGGFTSYPGVVIGGLSLGVMEGLVSSYISTDLMDTFAFVLLIIVLLIRPEGILGKRIRMLGKTSSTEESGEFDSSRPGMSMRKKLAFLIVSIALPFVFQGNTYILYFAVLTGIYMILAIGLDFLVGYTGKISLGHAALLAIGAYSSVILTSKVGFPFWLALLSAGIITGLVGLLLGFAALRLSGLYLAIVTLGLGTAVPQILLKWDEVTNGYTGLHAAIPSIGFFIIDTEFEMYFLVLAIVIVTIIVTNNILRSKIGRAFVALRDSEAGAEAMGVQLAKYQILAFVISAFFAGIAGSLYAHVVGFISPADFSIWNSLLFISMLFIGGVASIPGAMLGAAFMTMVPIFFAGSKSISAILFGGALLIIILFFPSGLAGFYKVGLNIGKRLFSRNSIGLKGPAEEEGTNVATRNK